MTPKELRSAAENFSQASYGYLSSGLLNSDVCAVQSMARHILATVREDDYEPVTEEMIDQCGCKGNSVSVSHTTVTHFKALTTTMCVALLGPTGDWITIEKCKTRSQFRSLCKGLGVELKENTNAE